MYHVYVIKNERITICMNSPIVFGVSVLNYYYYLRFFFLMRYLSRNLSFWAIMDLAQKFDGVTCATNISVSELDVNRKYRILQARRLTTRFGPSVILTVKYEDAAPVQVFLPRRYSDVFSDIEQINSNDVFLHLLFKGVVSLNL